MEPQTPTWSHRRGSLTVEDELLEEEEQLWIDDADDDHTGWFCVSTDPFPCPAAACTFIAVFMTAAHLVLVWEERDDPEPALACAACDGGRPQSARRSLRAQLRAERLVLRLGGGRASRARCAWKVASAAG